MKPVRKKSAPSSSTAKAKSKAKPSGRKKAPTVAAAPTAESKAKVKKAAPRKKAVAAAAVKPAPAKAAAPKKRSAVKKKASATMATPRKTDAAKSVKPAAKKKAVAKKKAAPKATAPAPSKPAAKKTAAPKPAVKKTSKTKPAASKTEATPRKPAKKVLPKIPSILLEGDESRESVRSGPGSRYDLGVDTSDVHLPDEDLILPEAYGTKRLQLVARDPQWLYAHWDLSNEQLQTYNQLSRAGHLTLQVYENEVAGSPKVEIDVHPESRSWFAHVGKGGGAYVAVLGFRDKVGDWQQIAVSPRASTPPDSLSDDLEAVFTSVPVTVSFRELVSIVKKYAVGEPRLARAMDLILEVDIPELQDVEIPAAPPSAMPRWTEAQQQALADAVTMESVRRTWNGSEEILDLIRGRAALSSESAVPAPGMSGVSSLSSPFGGEAGPGARGFWFNVNAELIIYGATEPDASVTIGGREIRLREDGTFSYRFALPDGNYGLPVAATSADKVETRSADLKFSRATDYRGDVGAHPQDPKLKKPDPKNVS